MARGLSFAADKLKSASQDVAELQQYCLAMAEDAVAALAGMAGCAGHPGLSSALRGAAGRGNESFTGI